MVLAWVSPSYPLPLGRFLRITHPSATRRHLGYPKRAAVRLACVKHTASVQSEPGSNSSIKFVVLLLPYFYFRNFLSLGPQTLHLGSACTNCLAAHSNFYISRAFQRPSVLEETPYYSLSISLSSILRNEINFVHLSKLKRRLLLYGKRHLWVSLR